MGQMTSRGFRATPSTNNDIREALNAAFSFRPTPQSLEASTLLAKNNEVPAEIDFDLHLPLLKSALSQHKKADVIRLMQDLARANAPARAFILQRVERYTKQMEEQMTQAQQKAASSSNAAKISANAKNIDVQQPPSDKEAKEGSPAPSDKMSLQEAVLHGQLSARELEGVLRDLHRDITLSPADEQQIKDEARALWEAGTAAVLAVDQSLPKHFTAMVIDAFPWADLLLADEVTKLVIESPVSKAAARIRATEVLARQENIKKNMSWISRLILPSIAPSKIKKGQTPHVYDAALDAYIHNDFDKLLSTPSGEKLTEATFRHVVQKFEDAPENIARTIAATLHDTFVGHFIARTMASGIDYYSPKSFAKKLLTPMKPLNPYFAQRKRELDSTASASASASASA